MGAFFMQKRGFLKNSYDFKLACFFYIIYVKMKKEKRRDIMEKWRKKARLLLGEARLYWYPREIRKAHLQFTLAKDELERLERKENGLMARLFARGVEGLERQKEETAELEKRLSDLKEEEARTQEMVARLRQEDGPLAAAGLRGAEKELADWCRRMAQAVSLMERKEECLSRLMEEEKRLHRLAHEAKDLFRVQELEDEIYEEAKRFIEESGGKLRLWERGLGFTDTPDPTDDPDYGRKAWTNPWGHYRNVEVDIDAIDRGISVMKKNLQELDDLLMGYFERNIPLGEELLRKAR